MGSHARLSPSGCDRWSTCTASVGLLDKLHVDGAIGDRDASDWSAEGTVAHEVREMCLVFGLDARHFVGATISADGFTYVVDDTMADHLQTGIDWVREHTGAPHVEIQVDLSPWLPDQFGTCDTGWLSSTALSSGVVLYISDLKFGAGVPVDAKGNKQLRLYALGMWHFLGRPHVEKIVINIDQPRAGGMKYWEITLDELLAFGEEMKAVYAKIESGDVEFKPSEKACKWCEVRKAPGGCPPRDRWLMEMAADAYPELPNTIIPGYERQNLVGERRWLVVKHAPDIRARLAELHDESLRAALDGKPDPGSKAVDGDLGDRRIKDVKKGELLLTAALGDKAYKPRELIGIGEIEKLVKPGRKRAGHPKTWEALQTLLVRPPGKPKLVPEDHPKPALVQWDDDFDDLDTAET
ncbi:MULTISPECIES: DUF2800 domain-containing protein [unclassified Mesorhizobium]|uniref:DUF2800 domain-containing protein n=1 Tax=unclassified Mesorhizobium TaxID=325217 RepID=UPI001093AB22|nr:MULTISPECIES: DUF2800 domain-containing protein [unclassified Mesorhizobium]TGT90857.1 DUF2800 domain-containing protein [Mesorhizobium sp. M8A.F.Ca.ET.161.01.1.1]TGV43863.1 DUF2800 domain-containing protein [Mesorhizobium sp. M8A.F.Ca.ET.142.01.1.1]